MKYRVRLLRPEPRTSATGASSMQFVQSAVVWAERCKFSGVRSEEAWEHFADYSASYNIRDIHSIDAGWQLEELGGHLYNVVAVEPNRDRGMLTVRCERVNE